MADNYNRTIDELLSAMKTTTVRENEVQTHKITDIRLYPNYHFALFRNDRLQVQANVRINKGDIILHDKNQYKVVSVLKVEPTVSELTGYWDTQGSGKNRKRKWIPPVGNYKKGITNFHVLKIEKIV